jgi:hypothetical protein
LHGLATDLGMASLAQQCLTRLSLETDAMIQTAISKGVTLGKLLDLGSKPEDKAGQSSEPKNIVQVVFRHVLEDDKSHQRLVDLVVTRLAEHLDLDLWENLSRRISPRISLLVIKTMLQIRQIKAEDSLSLALK